MANLKYHNPNTGLWEEIKVSTKFKDLYNTTKLTQDQNYANIGITNYNPEEDVVFAIWNSTWLQKDEDYIVNGGLLRIESKDGSNWKNGDTFNFVVLKNVDKDAIPTADGSLIQDGSITIAKLATSIQNYINKIGVAALTTTAVTLSDAINELNAQLSERVYKSKNVLPVADSSLSATDFAGNLTNVYNALGSNTNFSFFTASNNFSSSIKKKLQDDLGVSFTNGFFMEITANANNTIPNKIFIYPNDSSRIFYMSFDNTVSIAREITIEDSSWLTLPLGIATASTISPKYRKIKNKTTLIGNFNNITASGNIIATLPVGYRSTTNLTIIVPSSTANTYGIISINTNGTITFVTTNGVYNASTVYYLDSISFLVD